jgi:hypothetical protein
MIKSKIDAREKALELATKLAIAQMEFNNYDFSSSGIIDYAQKFEKYLIGNADLYEYYK